MGLEVKDLAGVSKPLERLIEVVSSGVGRVTKSYFTKKDADAKAYEIKAIAQALSESRMLDNNSSYEDGKIKLLASSKLPPQATEIALRAEARMEFKQLIQQENVEAVCAQAAEELAEDTTVPEAKPEPEWISRFFRIAEDVSTDQIQYLWGKILAGEIRKPGSFSMRTLDVLHNLSNREAETFAILANYIVVSGNLHFFSTAYVDSKVNGLNFNDILNLKDAGLVVSDSTLSVTFGALNAGQTQFYMCGNKALKVFRSQAAGQTQIAAGLLTRVGIELMTLIKPQAELEYLKAIAQIFNAPGTAVSLLDIVWRDGPVFRWENEIPLIIEG